MKKLSWFQLLSLCGTSFLPLLFWVYPRLAVQTAGIDGQWSVLGVVILGLFVGLLQGLLNHRFPNISGADMTRLVYGRPIGMFVNLIYGPGYLLFLSISMFIFALTLKPFLPDTPRMVLVAGLVLVAGMGASYGVETMARTASFIYPLTSIVLIVVFTYNLIISPWYGIPRYPVHMDKVLYGSYELLPLFFGMNLFLLLSPHYEHIHNRSIRVPVLTVGIESIIIIIVYLGCLLLLGFEAMAAVNYPPAFVMRLIRWQGLLIERVGIVLVIMTTLFGVVFISNHLWAISTLLAKTFGQQEEKFKWYVFPVAIAAVIVCIFLKDEEQVDYLIRVFLVPLSWILLVVEPVIKLIVAAILHVRGEPTSRRT